MLGGRAIDELLPYLVLQFNSGKAKLSCLVQQPDNFERGFAMTESAIAVDIRNTVPLGIHAPE
jgi:hypothetical protein